MWDRHGSWLILVVVLGLGFNGGVEWHSYKCNTTITTIVEAGLKERNDLRARLRAVNDANVELVQRYSNAGAETKAAADKADKAVQKADETINRVNKLLNTGENE